MFAFRQSVGLTMEFLNPDWIFSSKRSAKAFEDNICGRLLTEISEIQNYEFKQIFCFRSTDFNAICKKHTNIHF